MEQETKTTKQRGGRRVGAGRPALPSEERLIPTTVRLLQDDIDQLKSMGNGNLSEGVRLATAIAVKQIKRKKPNSV